MAKVSGYVVQLSRPKLSNAAKGFLFTCGGVLGEKYTSILLVYMVYREDDVFFQVGGWEFSSKNTIDHEVDRKRLGAALGSKTHLTFDGF